MNVRPKSICSVPECGKFCVGRGYCKLHWRRFMKTGSPYGLLRRLDGEGSRGTDGYWYRRENGGRPRKTHILAAEKALGKPLPKGAVVHHADCDPWNDKNENLVICPSQAYHQLLHRRIRALEACGRADWLKCCICKQYGPEGDVVSSGGANAHSACRRAYAAEWRKSKIERKAA